MKLLTAILPLAAALFCVSCGVSKEYAEASAATAPYQTVVVKNFAYKVEEPDAAGIALNKQFPSVLSEQVQGTHKFSKVTTQPYAGRALRIEGDVTIAQEGNTALRVAVGVGTGKAHFFCHARYFDNSTGKLLGTLTVERSSRNGLIGAGDSFDVVRRAAAADIAEKAADFAPAN
jgi:hypothetical protein